MYSKLDTGRNDLGSGERLAFFKRGATIACFKSLGIFALSRDILMMFVKMGTSSATADETNATSSLTVPIYVQKSTFLWSNFVNR